MPKYQPKKFDHIFDLEGFSKEMMQDHYKLYQGYVENVNKLNDLLTKPLASTDIPLKPERAELVRRFGWEYDGMVLHELYFENLTNNKPIAEIDVQNAIADQFGSLRGWDEEFRAIALMRGIGWAALVKDRGGNMFNLWVDNHNVGLLVNTRCLLVMDMFEHAYIKDYGIEKKKYVNAFMDSIDWDVVNERNNA